MNMHPTTLDRIAEQAPTMTEAQRNWRIAAIALLSIRVIQGFIYWGGGSRRFIYAPSKLDPSAHSWMANKFQTAMPGALLGTDHLISFLLTHFYLLYAGVILFSAAELFAGAMLMTGLLTRLAALFSMGFSVLLMLMFGWQGATCIDEWTMASPPAPGASSFTQARCAARSFGGLVRIAKGASLRCRHSHSGAHYPSPQN
jgi:thiosulfate dehydrogenase (quinone)